MQAMQALGSVPRRKTGVQGRREKTQRTRNEKGEETAWRWTRKTPARGARAGGDDEGLLAPPPRSAAPPPHPPPPRARARARGGLLDGSSPVSQTLSPRFRAGRRPGRSKSAAGGLLRFVCASSRVGISCANVPHRGVSARAPKCPVPLGNLLPAFALRPAACFFVKVFMVLHAVSPDGRLPGRVAGRRISPTVSSVREAGCGRGLDKGGKPRGARTGGIGTARGRLGVAIGPRSSRS